MEQDNLKGQERPRHGSKTFYNLLNKMAETHDKKSHDYASNDNPFGNYIFAGTVANMFAHSSLDAGFAGRLAEKMYRLSVLEGGQKTPLNESIDDTERDIAVITTLWMVARKDSRVKNEPIKLKEKPTVYNIADHSINYKGVPVARYICSGCAQENIKSIIAHAIEMHSAIFNKTTMKLIYFDGRGYDIPMTLYHSDA